MLVFHKPSLNSLYSILDSRVELRHLTAHFETRNFGFFLLSGGTFFNYLDIFCIQFFLECLLFLPFFFLFHLLKVKRRHVSGTDQSFIHFTDELEHVYPLLSIKSSRSIQLHRPVTDVEFEAEVPLAQFIVAFPHL